MCIYYIIIDVQLLIGNAKTERPLLSGGPTWDRTLEPAMAAFLSLVWSLLRLGEMYSREEGMSGGFRDLTKLSRS